MKKTALAAVLAITVGTVLGFAGPAQASTTQVDGSGVLNNDFGDHYEELGNSLCNGCGDSQNTDLVVMWQSILLAEGYLGKSDIDGYFGSKTTEATKKWQRKAGLTADGMVGDNTWSRADTRLYWSQDSAGWWTVKYGAAEGNGYVEFVRGGTPDYGKGGLYSLRNAVGGGQTVSFQSGCGWSGEGGCIHLFKRTLQIR